MISMEPMRAIAVKQAGAGGRREHYILDINADGNETVTKCLYGPVHHIVG